MDYNSRASTPSDTETLPSYRSRETSPSFHGYDAAGVAVADQRASRMAHNIRTDATRMIAVMVRDAHDLVGEGMSFTLGFTSTLKNIFDAFKSRSCRTCRAAEGIRFKVNAKKLKDEDTPKALQLKHNDTLSIRAYSNKPGLCCTACQKTGYPSTNGTKYDGNVPLPCPNPPKSKQLMRLLFQDPDGKITGIMATSTYQMKHAMRHYARDTESDVLTLRFFLDGGGISDDDTAEELGMKNNAVIQVCKEMEGG